MQIWCLAQLLLKEYAGVCFHLSLTEDYKLDHDLFSLWLSGSSEAKKGLNRDGCMLSFILEYCILFTLVLEILFEFYYISFMCLMLSATSNPWLK